MYNRDELLKRIQINSKIMVGKPIIRGTRITLVHILGLLVDKTTPQEIIARYPRITQEDITACLQFAQEAVNIKFTRQHPMGDINC